jgi:predicted nucleic acid-binding protein
VIVIADTGPILHLFWIAASYWALPPKPILVVREVWEEVERHAPEAVQDSRLVRRDPLTTNPNLPAALDPGEKAAVTLTIEIPGCLELCDEREACRICAELKIQVIGSLGLIAQAVDEGRVDIERLFEQWRRCRCVAGCMQRQISSHERSPCFAAASAQQVSFRTRDVSIATFEAIDAGAYS